jgi:hypothetical protein
MVIDQANQVLLWIVRGKYVTASVPSRADAEYKWSFFDLDLVECV